jgi:putative FmdB family regulatory protein
MPIYQYRCNACGTFEHYHSLAEYLTPTGCPECSKIATKVILPAMVMPDWGPYDCPITGKVVWGRRAHAENLKQHGCRVFERGEREEFTRRKKERQRDFERSVERVVDKAAQHIALGARIID